MIGGNVDLDNKELNEKPADTAYGGCKYRLSYDAAEIKREFKQKKQELNDKKRASLATKTGMTVAVISVVAVFIVFGICILSYYNNAVKKIFGGGDENGNDTAGSSYSNVNVVND